VLSKIRLKNPVGKFGWKKSGQKIRLKNPVGKFGWKKSRRKNLPDKSLVRTLVRNTCSHGLALLSAPGELERDAGSLTAGAMEPRAGARAAAEK